MAVLHRAVRLFVLFAAAAPVSGQDTRTATPAPPATQAPRATEVLTLATVLRLGTALMPALPRVLWQPGSPDPTVILTAPDGSETLHRVVDGKPEGYVLLAASTLRAALGGQAAGPARFPVLRWLSTTTLRVEHERQVRHWQIGGEPAAPLLEWAAPDPGETSAQAVAPNDQFVAYVREHQLWLHARDGRLRQLTADGSPDIVYGNAPHRAEFGIDRGLYWSQDGRFLCFSREDQRPIAAYPYQNLETTPPEPRAGRYPMAGRIHSRVRLAVCDTANFEIRWLDQDPDEDVYWTCVTFAGDDTLVTARVTRAQDHLDLVRYDVKTGRRLAVLLQEHDPEWVEPEHGPFFLPDGRFLWWSTRSGNRHLWLHGADGTTIQQVTRGAFDVQRLLGLSSDGKSIWFQASGEDPRQLHLFTASLDGTEGQKVTRERGTHHAELSPDGRMASVVWSNLETPPNVRLLDLQSGAVLPLPAPSDPLAAFALPVQRLFQVKAEDDTVLYGHLALPPDLAPDKKVPVLLYVYGGPHVQLVTDQWFGGAPLWLQAFAAEGYAVCRLDNRGTSNRGIDFEQAVYRHLGVREVQDQLSAVEWLKQQPFVDGERIGVHGWSYGGYMTLRLLLAAPTTFACGVSGAPVTDWSLYETGYTERYMDSPAENPDGYHLSSCLPFVDRLQRPLLLVHGTDDRTVVWAHTLRFVDRCIDAGKQIDYFPYPMQQHRLLGKARVHFLTLLHDWLGRHLQPGAR